MEVVFLMLSFQFQQANILLNYFTSNGRNATQLAGIFFVGILMNSCKQDTGMFEQLYASTTNVDFVNKLEPREGFGILYYPYYYNGGGVATADINNDGLTDIYFTANSNGHNKLYLNKGDFKFEDITAEAGVAGSSDWCTGVTMADVNADGLMDMYVSVISNEYGLLGHNELYINQGANANGDISFIESSHVYGLDFAGFSTQAAFFDYDHDGDLDCYLLNQSNRPYQNIVDTSNRHKYDEKAGDRLYRNDMDVAGINKFTDVSSSAGIYQASLGYGLGLAIADINNDGWEDIYVGNDFHENDYYYVNNGNGTFTESGREHFGHYSRFSMGNDIADYNNDGQLDIVTADMLPPDEKIVKTYGSDENPDIYQYKITNNGFQYQSSKNCLQRNNGNGSSFSETALLSGIPATDWSWAPLLADFDNDGYKDLFVSSGIVKRPVDLDYVRYVSNLVQQKGNDPSVKYDEMALAKMPEGSAHPYFFKGDGDLRFSNVSREWGTASMKGFYNGAAYADLDNDGNLDVVMNCIDAPAVILKNNAPEKNTLAVAFKGAGGNTNGIGCKAYVFTKGNLQYQQLMLTRGFQSSVEPVLHFGLGEETTVDSLLVVWPGQEYQVIHHPAINTKTVVDQQNAAGGFENAQFFRTADSLFIDQTKRVAASFKHRENTFVDFNVQALIPHQESTRGPKMAVADVNADGLTDMFVCGASGQPGALLIQQTNGSFANTDNAVFSTDAMCEDVDAIFFDADTNGTPDLLVVSGGNEYNGNNPNLLDRLYLNDGKGHFTKSLDGLPAIYQNKSCTVHADIDKDGDEDIFIGVLADPIAYGLPQTSYLLVNDGTGHFSMASKQIIDLEHLGIVTCASFADMNKDGMPDLVVAGEWMPLTIFVNHGQSFVKTTVAHSSGLWQCILVDDVNSDGNADVLAGNWGQNTKFYCDKQPPLRLYVADFDGNGKTEQLLSYNWQGNEYPFLPKDEVERPLPLLKKHYLLYADYAGLPMKEVFYGWIENVKPVMAERLASTVFYGDGANQFTIMDLPAALQLAPVFSLAKMSSAPGHENRYIAGGNFYEVTPYEGRYDAQSLAVFSAAGHRSLQYHHYQDVASVRGQVRDVKWVHSSALGDLLVLAKNNEPLSFFKTR